MTPAAAPLAPPPAETATDHLRLPARPANDSGTSLPSLALAVDGTGKRAQAMLEQIVRRFLDPTT